MITAELITQNRVVKLHPISITVTEKCGAASYANAVFYASDISCKCGDKLRIRESDTLIFSGFIFEHGIDSENRLTVLAYDCLRYLQCTGSYFISQTTASSLVRRIANDFMLPTADIAETAHVIPLIDFDEQSLMNIISFALAETKANTARSYMLLSDDCKVSLIDRRSYFYSKPISDENVICAYETKLSAEGCANVIKLTSAGKGGYRYSYTAKDEDSIHALGYLKYSRSVSGKSTFELKELAHSLLAQKSTPTFTADLECRFLAGLRAGMQITLSLKKPSLYGTYAVDSLVHRIDENEKVSILRLKGATNGAY